MSEDEQELNELSGTIIGTAINIHRTFGPGLLESAYQQLMAYELQTAGLSIGYEIDIPLIYKSLYIPKSYRLDLLVNDKIIVELKSVKNLIEIHPKQVLTYLRLMNKRLGILINFNEVTLKNGIKRIINPYYHKE